MLLADNWQINEKTNKKEQDYGYLDHTGAFAKYIILFLLLRKKKDTVSLSFEHVKTIGTV